MPAAAMNSPLRDSPNLVDTWELFRSTCGRELQNWVVAERALAHAREVGSSETAAGDRLMAAEAVLQRAIVDFAAAQHVGTDPTPIALGLLRLAEHVLEESTGIDYAGLRHQRAERRRSVDRRRRQRTKD
jgi:hypothetical protein